MNDFIDAKNEKFLKLILKYGFREEDAEIILEFLNSHTHIEGKGWVKKV